jgi:hypothetical protein
VKKTRLQIDELAALDLELACFIDEIASDESSSHRREELVEYDRPVRGVPWGDAARVHRHFQPRATLAHQLRCEIRRAEWPWLELVRKIHRYDSNMTRHGVAVWVARRLTAAGHRVHWKTIENWINAAGGLKRIGVKKVSKTVI